MSAEEPRGKANRSHLIAAVAIAVLVVSLFEFAVGTQRVGITFDEPLHAKRTQAWIDTGWYVPERFLVDEEPGSEAAASPYVYGPAYSATAHGLNRLVANESAGEISRSESAWLTRHIVVALLAIAGALAAAVSVWAITGSRIFALWTAAALCAIPIWTGMGFFNPKDIPAAAGYTLFTTGLILAFGRKPDDRVPIARGFAIFFLVAAGYFFGAGTRLALWLPLAGSLGLFMLLYWLRFRFGGFPRDSIALISVAAGVAAGVAVTVLVYPAVFAEPLSFLTNTITNSADFDWTGSTLTAGSLLSQQPPWWYLPIWLFASMPLLLLLLAITGAVVLFRPIGRPVRRFHGLGRDLIQRPEFPGIIVLFQALPLAVGSVVLSSVMYTGLRQFLFMVPALAILAGIGGFHLWRYARARARVGSKGPARMVLAALCLALIIPTVEGGLLFPYNYVYVNPIAGVGGVNGNWETDFFWASSREAADRVPDDVRPVCTPKPDPRLAYPIAVIFQDCARFGLPYFRALDASQPPIDNPSGPAWALARLRENGRLPEYCRSVDDVTRWLRGEQVVMSYVAQCLLPKTRPFRPQTAPPN